MKTGTTVPADGAAPIVHLAHTETTPATPAAEIERARSFAEPLLAGRLLDTGEPAWTHAQGVASILEGIGAAPTMRASAYLVYAADFLARPEEVVEKAFGASHATLVMHTRRLVQLQRAARHAQVAHDQHAQQTERVRKMLLAFSRDLRVVLMRLASRLQTLRWHAASKVACPGELAQESLQVFAPLANRLGIWQIKWELEDLSFRFLQPLDYRRVASLLDQSRIEREAVVERARASLAKQLDAAGIRAQVQGRPKHLYSIWKKMQGKSLDFAQIYDVRALRVVVDDLPACYAALSQVHDGHTVVEGEFDDYIARPKPNGYQSLHTVVLADDGLPLEVQIRTQAMHRYAEQGVAAHWAYKEAGVRGYGGVSVDLGTEERVAEARKAVLRQLLAWEREQAHTEIQSGAGFDDRIYVFTPQAALIELPAGGTPVDFAYSLHTDLGHRCRGARVDGRVVPLSTPLSQGQTVEIVSAKEGGPSLDWLNPDLHFLASARAKAKVRAWFNAQAQAQTMARGREQVEKLLQREGRTAIKLDDLAAQLGFKGAEALFEVVGKDEFSLRNIEQLLRPQQPAQSAGESVALWRSQARGDGVLVVGVESLMTALARCCRPAPPDDIGGYVTRGKGVAIHRRACSNFREMAQRAPERVISVAWGRPGAESQTLYPVDVVVEAADRNGLLRDISEVFAREKIHITGVHTQSSRSAHGDSARMVFTIEVADATRLGATLRQVMSVPGVRQARRQ